MYKANKRPPRTSRPLRKKPSFLGLVVGGVSIIFGVSGILGVSRPDALAILGFPAIGLAGGGEVLSDGLCGLLGSAVLNFEVFHRYHFLSFLYLNCIIEGLVCQAFFI